MASETGKDATLISATHRLQVVVDELSETLGTQRREGTDKEPQIALPTPAEQRVFDAMHQIMRITTQLEGTLEVITSLLSAIGD